MNLRARGLPHILPASAGSRPLQGDNNMNFGILGRFAGAVALTVGLAGCMDVTMELEVLDETNGRMTTTAVVGADFYPMMKAGMAQAGAATDGAAAAPAEPGFCEEEGDVLTENADGSATCVSIKEGTLAELGEGDDAPKFEVVSPGVVKVSFSTEQMAGELGADETMDEETKAMMQAFFEGHNITIRIKGKEVTAVEGMTIGADKTSADIAIPFLDLINGTVSLPPNLSATVKTN
jgi:hypothetical protein